MKRSVCFVFSLLGVPTFCFAMTGCSPNVCIYVTDEDGLPVESAYVNVRYQSGWVPGEGFGKALVGEETKITDGSGLATFGIRPFGSGSFQFSADTRDTKRYHGSCAQNGSLSSDGEPVRYYVQLRAQQKPIPLMYDMFDHTYQRRTPKFRWHTKTQTAEETTCITEKEGYDLVLQDWLPPRGKDKVADVVFYGIRVFSSKHEPNDSSTNWSCKKIAVAFPNPGDGMVDASIKWPTSMLMIDYEAPPRGYDPVYTLTWHYPPRKSDYSDMLGEPCLKPTFFRIRTQKDREGKVVYA